VAVGVALDDGEEPCRAGLRVQGADVRCDAVEVDLGPDTQAGGECPLAGGQEGCFGGAQGTIAQSEGRR
jgi:hypothetical protein